MGHILFSAKETVFIQARKKWNGILEYSYDNREWKKWDGEQISNNTIYMRGINNTVVSGLFPWNVNGNNIKCQGNIENLLDYQSVINNIHPKMGKSCFANMFAICKQLIETPQLLSTELTEDCYLAMFFSCEKLKTVSSLLATNLPNQCYYNMFTECLSLTFSPIFPSWTIAKEVIINQHMLDNCPIQQININNKLYDINVLKLL